MRHLKLAMLNYGTTPRASEECTLMFEIKIIQATEHQFRNIILNKVERGVKSRFMYAPLEVPDVELHKKLNAALRKHFINELTFFTGQLEELDGQTS